MDRDPRARARLPAVRVVPPGGVPLIAAALAVSAALAAAPLAQQREDDSYEEGAGTEPRRLRLALWGGEALADGGRGHGSPLWGGEASWAFDRIDLGLAGYGYQTLPDARRAWTPVVLLRLTERFRTRSGLEAAFTFGAGAGRPVDWTAWFQVALGLRMDLGPVFLGGELAFEQNDLLRLAAGVGVAF